LRAGFADDPEGFAFRAGFAEGFAFRAGFAEGFAFRAGFAEGFAFRAGFAEGFAFAAFAFAGFALERFGFAMHLRRYNDHFFGANIPSRYSTISPVTAEAATVSGEAR
jgi:hypothetical protein